LKNVPAQDMNFKKIETRSTRSGQRACRPRR